MNILFSFIDGFPITSKEQFSIIQISHERITPSRSISFAKCMEDCTTKISLTFEVDNL